MTNQDHYGGLSVVDALAERARIGTASQVADFCAGLAGPARYLAHKYGAIVTCIELNPHRAPGAADLTRRVGLDRRVRTVRGDVMRVPLAQETMDAVVSQEALPRSRCRVSCPIRGCCVTSVFAMSWSKT